MKHRFYVPGDLVAGERVVLPPGEFHHGRVTRVRDGEVVEVFNENGLCMTGTIRIDEQRTAVRLIEPVSSRESARVIRLAMSVIQLDNFELVLQKATELGVRSIIPLLTERMEVREERFRGKADRWRKIVLEAVKQSGRSIIPSIEAPQPYADVMRREGMKVIFDADENAGTLAVEPAELTIFIGPEGGWSAAEIAVAREGGAVFQQLGPRRLRAETAAIAGTALFAELA